MTTIENVHRITCTVKKRVYRCHFISPTPLAPTRTIAMTIKGITVENAEMVSSTPQQFSATFEIPNVCKIKDVERTVKCSPAV